MSATFETIDISDTVRVRWVHDDDYQSEGSYAYETEEETRLDIENEQAKLASGEWIVLGAIVEKKCSTCEHWHECDSVWGVVVDPVKEDLGELAIDFFRHEISS